MPQKIEAVLRAKSNRCRPYSEMLTYKPLTNNAVLRKIPTKIRNKSNK
jgi:hypothetical protein